MSTNMIADLEQFTKEMAKYDERQVIKSEPEIVSPEILALRTTLIEEEIQETLESMHALEEVYRDIEFPDRANTIKRYFAEVADGIADSIVVLIGTALAYGIPLQKVWDEVQRANMDKVTELTTCGCGEVHMRVPRQPKIREDGKILKPDGWKAPQVQQIIEEAMK